MHYDRTVESERQLREDVDELSQEARRRSQQRAEADRDSEDREEDGPKLGGQDLRGSRRLTSRLTGRIPMGFRQFLLRGLERVRFEWDLVCLAYNMKRIYSLRAAKI